MPSVGTDVEQVAFYSLLVGKKIKLPLGKINWQFFINLNIHILFGPAIPLLSAHPREMKLCVHTKICT